MDRAPKIVRLRRHLLRLKACTWLTGPLDLHVAMERLATWGSWIEPSLGRPNGQVHGRAFRQLRGGKQAGEGCRGR